MSFAAMLVVGWLLCTGAVVGIAALVLAYNDVVDCLKDMKG